MSNFNGSYEQSTLSLRFVTKLSSLMRCLNQPQESIKKAVNIKARTEDFPPHLASRLQEHDAQELLVFVRDQIDIASKHLNEQQDSLRDIRKVFDGRLERQFRCAHCNYQKDSRFETLEELILALPTSNSNALTLSGYH